LILKNDIKIKEFKSDNSIYLGRVYVVGIDKYRIPNSASLGEVHIYRGSPSIGQHKEQNSNESP
jgi:hypothetical protein